MEFMHLGDDDNMTDASITSTSTPPPGPMTHHHLQQHNHTVVFLPSFSLQVFFVSLVWFPCVCNLVCVFLLFSLIMFSQSPFSSLLHFRSAHPHHLFSRPPQRSWTCRHRDPRYPWRTCSTPGAAFSSASGWPTSRTAAAHCSCATDRCVSFLWL